MERTHEALARAQEEERKRDQEERQRREHRAAHERWKQEEIIPYRVLQATSQIANRSKTLRAPDGRTIVYTITQKSHADDIVLRVDGFQIAFLPPPLDLTARDRVLALYEEHRASLGPGVTDVTGWDSLPD